MIKPLVMKFGGTSVAGADAMSNVGRIVAGFAGNTRPVLVVVSAMSGVTDALLAACAAARDGGAESVERHVADLESRHLAVVQQLFGATPGAEALSAKWRAHAMSCVAC